MTLAKWLLLYAYYQGTRPARWWVYRRLAARRRMPIAVLYYHRVADSEATPCTMSNRDFLDQVDWLRRNFELVSLEEAQRRLRGGVNDRKAVHITFDDGYADNCQTAIPWLVKERIPCTYFVSVGNILDGRPFEHDLRCGVSPAPNSLDEIRAMAGAGIEIGAHTYSHADLGKITDAASLHREIVFARQELCRAIGAPVRYFSFPFGLYANLSCEAFALAAQSGYEGVCSAYGGYNYPGDDPFHIQRIPAVDEKLRLQNWLSADPRRLHTRRFEYRGHKDCVLPPATAKAEIAEIETAETETAKIEGKLHVLSP